MAFADRIPTEHEEQVTLLEWARVLTPRHPELGLLFAIANAGAGAQKGQAGKMKAEGVKPGVPDLFLPVARMGLHGLFVEMKRTSGGTLSLEQRAWHQLLFAQQYSVVIARGAIEGSSLIVTYLGLSQELALR